MREFKIRAWNGNKMYYDPIVVDGIVFRSTKDFLNGVDVTDPIMQYTGLKDKNGKEICEGDIVLYDRNISSFIDKYQYTVEWVEDGYCLNNSNSGIVDNVSWELTEVIGNIYEKPSDVDNRLLRTKCPKCKEWCYLKEIGEDKYVFNCSNNCNIPLEEGWL